MMRHRMWFVSMVLVAALLLGGLTGCQREAAVRQPQATAAQESGRPAEGTTAQTPVPGVTVVSAVTSLPQTGAQPTQAPQAGQPGESQATPTAALPETTVVATEPAATAAPVVTASAPAATAEYTWYTVQAGDTLVSIAMRYGTTVQAIVNLNGLSNPNQIILGQKLKIPKADGSSGGSSAGQGGCRFRHTVKAGEWVYQIARTYGVDPGAVLRANGLSVSSVIHPGQVLCIP